MKYYLYILRCSDNSLYCGIAKDIDKRLKEHQSGKKGSKYLRSKKPFKLVYSEKYKDKKTAMQREFEVKSWPKSKKESFISNG